VGRSDAAPSSSGGGTVTAAAVAAPTSAPSFAAVDWGEVEAWIALSTSDKAGQFPLAATARRGQSEASADLFSPIGGSVGAGGIVDTTSQSNHSRRSGSDGEVLSVTAVSRGGSVSDRPATSTSSFFELSQTAIPTRRPTDEQGTAMCRADDAAALDRNAMQGS
jgi:hypothetical protein